MHINLNVPMFSSIEKSSSSGSADQTGEQLSPPHVQQLAPGKTFAPDEVQQQLEEKPPVKQTSEESSQVLEPILVQDSSGLPHLKRHGIEKKEKPLKIFDQAAYDLAIKEFPIEEKFCGVVTIYKVRNYL